jgi:predicted RNase H-like HicB family nuclease
MWAMPKTISVRKDKVGYIAHYKTLDIVAQGTTKEEARLNLLDCIMIQIDFAVENDNMDNLAERCCR